MIEYPAAPAPETTTLTSLASFLTNFKALIKAAVTTIAVPCWSSWNTGISSSSINALSISTHLGEEISSRLIPPKVGARAFIIAIISLGSIVSKTIGTAFIPPNFLNKQHFPSITGIAASGPISPRPKTAVPSEITAIVFALLVYL